MWMALALAAFAAEPRLCAPEDAQGCHAACDMGHAPSCARLGHLLRSGVTRWGSPTVEVDGPGARAAYSRGCDAGYAPACNTLGFLWDEGEAGPRDAGKAGALYRKACDLGYGTGCYNLAVDRDEASDVAGATPLYQKACELGESAGCLELGSIYEAGDGVKADLSKALALYGRSFQASVAISGRLDCPEGTVLLREYAIFGAGVEHFCAKPAPRPVKHGPWMEWASEEDEAVGAPDGVVRGRGHYVDGKKHGVFERRDARGELTSRAEYKNGVEDGLSEKYERGVLTEKDVAGWLEPGDPKLAEVGLADQRARMQAKYDAEGRLRSERFYDAQERRVGLWRRWAENGQLVEEERFVDGVKQGVARAYTDAGALAWEGAWVEGERHGPWRRLRPDGTVYEQGSYERGEKHGPWFEQAYSEGYRGTWNRGRRSGAWTTLDAEGRKACELTYVDDAPHGETRCFHENGRLREVGAYAHGKPVGAWKTLHEDGKTPAREASYVDGAADGTWTTYWPSGEKQSATVYAAGCRVSELEWHENGQKAREGRYEACVPHGAWRAWYPDGRLQSEGAYASGREVGTWTEYHPNGQRSWEAVWEGENRLPPNGWDEDGTPR